VVPRDRLTKESLRTDPKKQLQLRVESAKSGPGTREVTGSFWIANGSLENH
jgi:hypothetical protein